MRIASALWASAKLWRSFSLGPIALHLRFARSTALTSNRRRRVTPRCPEPSASSAQWTLPAVPATEAALGQVAFVMGVGPGLGAAIARRFVAGGLHVALAARNVARLQPFARSLRADATSRVHAYSCDATSDASVKDVLSLVENDLGCPHVVVYSVQGFARAAAIDVETSVFEDHWRQNCLGAFVFAREAARMMLPHGRGTIVLIGSTSGMVGRPDHLTLAVGKFGLRALAHILARELGPRGIHVAHLVVDADIKEDELHGADVPQAEPEHIAELVWMLHRQPRSAWTSELDVRPADERFWEHC